MLTGFIPQVTINMFLYFFQNNLVRFIVICYLSIFFGDFYNNLKSVG